jgi:Family of unknown function (DUF6441)
MRLRFEYTGGQFTKRELLAEQSIARAATAAMRQVGQVAKEAARASIASGGLGDRMQNALREQTYPKSGTSLSPAASLWDNSRAALSFEEGLTISGAPLLWLPFKDAGVPKGPGGKHLGPADLAAAGAQLVRLKGTHIPIIAAIVRESDATAGKPLSRKRLRAGRRAQVRAGFGSKVKIVVKPLFLGVPQIHDPKRTSIIDAIKQAADQLGEFYEASFVDL